MWTQYHCLAFAVVLCASCWLLQLPHAGAVEHRPGRRPPRPLSSDTPETPVDELADDEPSRVPSQPAPILRDGVVFSVNVEYLCPSYTGTQTRVYVRFVSSSFPGASPYSVSYPAYRSSGVPYVIASTSGSYLYYSIPSLFDIYTPTLAVSITSSGSFTMSHGGVTYRSFYEGFCGWCGQSSTGTHGNNVCNLPCEFCGEDRWVGSHGNHVCNATYCPLCGGNNFHCVHGEHTCDPGGGGEDPPIELALSPEFKTAFWVMV